jgi:hypothetical protein
VVVLEGVGLGWRALSKGTGGRLRALADGRSSRSGWVGCWRLDRVCKAPHASIQSDDSAAARGTLKGGREREKKLEEGARGRARDREEPYGPTRSTCGFLGS